MRETWIAAGALVALAAVSGFALSQVWTTRGDTLAYCRGGQVAGGDIGGPFTLVDASGQTVTDAEVFATPTILYFGFTFCPDVCPLDLARNAEAVALLEERGIVATPVFVSVDPWRDTPAVVGAYVAHFHPRMVGLTGSPEQVEAAADAWRVYHRRVGDDPDTYVVDHSTFSYLVLPQQGFVDVVARDEPPEAVADRLECFVEAAA